MPLPASDMSAGTKLDIKLTKKTNALGFNMLVVNPLVNAWRFFADHQIDLLATLIILWVFDHRDHRF